MSMGCSRASGYQDKVLSMQNPCIEPGPARPEALGGAAAWGEECTARRKTILFSPPCNRFPSLGKTGCGVCVPTLPGHGRLLPSNK